MIGDIGIRGPPDQRLQESSSRIDHVRGISREHAHSHRLGYSIALPREMMRQSDWYTHSRGRHTASQRVLHALSISSNERADHSKKTIFLPKSHPRGQVRSVSVQGARTHNDKARGLILTESAFTARSYQTPT